MRINLAKFVCLLAVAIAAPVSAGELSRAALRLLPAAPPAAALAHWPDSLTCHFPPVKYVDSVTGLPTGKGYTSPFTVIVRLTLAPAINGLYYYGIGPIQDSDSAEVADFAGTHEGLKPGAYLAFHPDGTPASHGRGECSGKTVDELIAAGLARR